MDSSHCKTLVSLSLSVGVAAICEDERDGSLWITSDLENRHRLPAEAVTLRVEPHGVTEALQIDDVQPLGGHLPPGARSVELRASYQVLAEPLLGPDVWVAALRAERHDHDRLSWLLFDHDPPFALFRDASGQIVPQPLPEGAQMEPVVDADSPCPGCGGREWNRTLSGAGGNAPLLLVCARCGHRERADGQMLVATAASTEMDERELENARREHERERLRAIRRQLDGVPLPLYGLGPQWHGTRTIHFVNRHRGSGSIDLFHGGPSGSEPTYVDIENAWGSDGKGSVEARAREAVFKCLLQEQRRRGDRQSSEATMLAFQSDLRDRRRRTAAAALREEGLSVDGELVTFVMAEGEGWVAGAGSAGELGLALIARGVPLGELALAKVHDLTPYLGDE